MITTMQHSLTRSLAILGAFVLSVAPLKAEGPAPASNQAQFEVRFLTEMIDHHAMAVMTGMLCEERAVHSELRELCQNIVETQMAEIELMQNWLNDWYGISHEPEMTPGAERQMEKLAELSAEEFEIEFMTMMIKHHAKAVKRGLHCIEKAYHPELIDLCHDIVESQSAEIALMEAWLCEWYDLCH